MDSKLISAFKFHMRGTLERSAIARAPNATPAIMAKRGFAAMTSLEKARNDVLQGVNRYPSGYRSGNGVSWQPHQPGIAHLEKPESVGLRFVGRVVPEMRLSHIWDSRGNTGWYTDPHGDVFKDGTGLCYGVVYQLPGRNGESRFVAGYEFGGVDGGPTLDFGRIYAEPRGDSYITASDCDAAIDAARAADSMAESAAEDEREYQTAWQAGSRWGDAAEVISAARKQCLSLMSERKKAMRGAEMDSGYAEEFPTICRAIVKEIRDLVESIAESRAEQRKLAEGDAEGLYFWPGEQRLRDAFIEGAGLDKFPA